MRKMAKLKNKVVEKDQQKIKKNLHMKFKKLKG